MLGTVLVKMVFTHEIKVDLLKKKAIIKMSGDLGKSNLNKTLKNSPNTMKMEFKKIYFSLLTQIKHP